MVLLDSGKFDVFDRENKSVITAKFANYVDSANDIYKTNSGLPDFVDVSGNGADDDQEYDPEKEYQRRLENLRQWLRARNLLIEVVSQVYDLNSVQVIQATGGEVGEFTPFDPNVDYAMRFNKLLQLVKDANIPFLPVNNDPAVATSTTMNVNIPRANNNYDGNYNDNTRFDMPAMGGAKNNILNDNEIVLDEYSSFDIDPNSDGTQYIEDQSQQKQQQIEMDKKMNENLNWFKNSGNKDNDAAGGNQEILFDANADYQRRLEDLKRFIGAMII